MSDQDQGPGGGGIPTSESLRVVARFTRTDADTIEYELAVEDSVVLTRPWKAAFTWKRDSDYYIYEYACHEGNQAISNALPLAVSRIAVDGRRT